MRTLLLIMFLAVLALLAGCGDSGNSESAPGSIVVNSLLDSVPPAEGEVTLRAAVEQIANGGTISFDPSLNGGTIELTHVGTEHTVLKGEVMGFDFANNISYLVGYFDRDYGKSALYTRKTLAIDASALADGITLAWTGDDNARVLAVYGNLAMNNVTVTGGNSVAEEIAGYDPDAEPGSKDSQPWTLGRGGALAVWGEAILTHCTLHDNHCLGDFDQSRDRGAFGGGLYADIVRLSDCVLSGNSVVGGGAAGGGVYSVGGAESRSRVSTIERSSITGNRISGVFTYGGGAYSDGGGIGNLKALVIRNSTIARNLVEPPLGHVPPFLLPTLLDLGYWRGGGVYMSNGYLELHSITLVENEVYGKPRTDSNIKPNLAGGIAATIGDAHAVESMIIDQSIIAGNLVHELDDTGTSVNSYQNDLFTGSLLHFYSRGYNLIGRINFDHMLVPVPQWQSLSRKHWPETGDSSAVEIDDVLDLGGVVTHASIISRGVDSGSEAVLWYPPAGEAVDSILTDDYSVSHTLAEIRNFNYSQPGTIEDFLPAVLDYLETRYKDTWASDLYKALGDPTGISWYGPAVSWPTDEKNRDWIEFWHELDAVIGDNLGVEKLGDDFWAEFEYTASISGLVLEKREVVSEVALSATDQLGTPRNTPGDIGAIELDP
jgi:hypothetical protein